MLNNPPLVSIICMCYNHEKYVVDALNSVVNQKYSNIEIIISDDASTDNSTTIIDNWLKTNKKQNILFIKNTINLGNTTSFNNALKKSKGTFILDFATDDILKPECILLQINKFHTSTLKNVGVVYGNAKYIDENNNLLYYYYQKKSFPFFRTKPPSGYIYNYVLADNIICPTSMLIKKEVFNCINGYDDTLEYEDLDFWLKSSKNYNYEYIDEVLMCKRELSTSLSKDFYRASYKGKKIRFTTYKIIYTTLKSLTKREELKAILKRIHYEFFLNVKSTHISLAIKYIYLKLIIHYKLFIMH